MCYGTRALLALALNYEKGVVSIREMAARQQVSPKYLEHLLASLRSAGLVRSVRGAQGGHTLTRHPDEINLRDVYHAFEGMEGFVECTTGLQVSERIDSCVTREIWSHMYAMCMEMLGSTTLGDLARRADPPG
jgi:Rrf2 family protein